MSDFDDDAERAIRRLADFLELQQSVEGVRKDLEEALLALSAKGSGTTVAQWRIEDALNKLRAVKPLSSRT